MEIIDAHFKNDKKYGWVTRRNKNGKTKKLTRLDTTNTKYSKKGQKRNTKEKNEPSILVSLQEIVPDHFALES